MDDPRARSLSNAEFAAWAETISPEAREANKDIIRRTLATSGFKDPDVDAFLIWVGQETGGTWSSKAREAGAPAGRGGFGLTQLTGPRASAFLQWCTDTGEDPNSMVVQLRFIVMELEDDPVAVSYHGGSVVGSAGSWGGVVLKKALSRRSAVADKVGAWVQNYFRPANQSKSAIASAIQRFSKLV